MTPDPRPDLAKAFSVRRGQRGHYPFQFLVLVQCAASFAGLNLYSKKKDIVMENKDIINKGLTGTGMFADTAAADIMKNDIDELQQLEVLESAVPPSGPGK